QDLVEGRAIREAGAEFRGLGLQSVVAQRGHIRFERVDRFDTGFVSLDLPVVGGAEKTLGEGAQACHQVKFLLRCAPDVRGRLWLVNRARASADRGGSS